MDILRVHGEQKELYEYSLENALALAKGNLSLVVVLQEPRNTADVVPYDVMVYGDASVSNWGPERVGSATLQEIDSLAEDSSKGRYGLRDVSIFDLNTLLPKDLQEESDNVEADLVEAQGVFWDMVLAKQPDAILVLTATARSSKHKQVKCLGSSLRKAGSTRPFILHTGNGRHESLIIYGFHPNAYLREDYVAGSNWLPEDVSLANEVLRVCFAKAFEASCGLPRDSIHDNEVLNQWREFLASESSLDVQTAFAHLAIE